MARSILELTEEEAKEVYIMAFDEEPEGDFRSGAVTFGDGRQFFRVDDYAYLLQITEYGGVYARDNDTATPGHILGYRLFKYLEEIGVVFKETTRL